MYKVHSGTPPKLTVPRKTHTNYTMTPPQGLQNHVKPMQKCRVVFHKAYSPAENIYKVHSGTPPKLAAPQKTYTKCTVVPTKASSPAENTSKCTEVSPQGRQTKCGNT